MDSLEAVATLQTSDLSHALPSQFVGSSQQLSDKVASPVVTIEGLKPAGMGNYAIEAD